MKRKNADSDEIFDITKYKLTTLENLIEMVEDYSKKKCFYTAYQTLIDWNGDVFLCPQDWQRRQTMGNIMQEDFFEIWKGQI